MTVNRLKCEVSTELISSLNKIMTKKVESAESQTSTLPNIYVVLIANLKVK